MELPDYHKKRKDPEEMKPEETRSYYKEMGIQPVRPWYERQIAINCTGAILEMYVPPEGDGKLSPLNSAVNTLSRKFLDCRYSTNPTQFSIFNV